MPNAPSERSFSQRIAGLTYRILKWGKHRLPPGVRSLVGVLFMLGGVFGFLPVLGFWMFPLGAAFVAMDIPPLRRRIDNWMVELQARATGEYANDNGAPQSQDPAPEDPVASKSPEQKP